MFKSYTCEAISEGWKYIIEDDDFTDDIILTIEQFRYASNVFRSKFLFVSIINIYTKRELNVAANLAKAIMFVKFRWTEECSIRQLGEFCVPNWEKWAPEIERYLLLI